MVGVIDILLNGTSIFSANATATNNSDFINTAVDGDLTQTGTVFSSSFTTNGGLSGYQFGAFSDTLSLNLVVGMNTLIYTMFSSADGLIGETEMLASIGDPLVLSTNNPGVTLQFTPSSTASEPTTLVLMILGIGMLLLRGRSLRPGEAGQLS